MNNVASSWKTTVVGLVSAGLYAWANAGNMDAKHIAVTVLMAVIGAAMHDSSLFGPTAAEIQPASQRGQGASAGK